ncbi:MAG: HNH endonuclease [bacterium]|nr:HNH endonuclease [bacterium]
MATIVTLHRLTCRAGWPTGGPFGPHLEQLAAFTSDSNRWPRDREFKQAWRDQPVFRRMTRQRVRMILLALEDHLHDDKNEAVKFDKKLSIEHLMPRRWKTAHWPLPGTAEPESEMEERDRALHTIGNLTLLRQKLNSSVSNGPFAAKQKAILKHSALNLNRPLPEWRTAGTRALSGSVPTNCSGGAKDLAGAAGVGDVGGAAIAGPAAAAGPRALAVDFHCWLPTDGYAKPGARLWNWLRTQGGQAPGSIQWMHFWLT